MGQMIGSTGAIAETARPSPDFMGPMPGARQGSSGALGALAAGYDKMQNFASFLGDTPEERANNAKKFAAMVKDIGNLGTSISDSTLMQRMMKEQMKGPMAITEGQNPSGGVGAIPRTFDPGSAAGIMSRLGFK